MLSLSNFIKNFILCLATIVIGFSYSGQASTVTAQPDVTTELVIDSEESDKIVSPYFFRNVSVDHSFSDFTSFRFACYLHYQNISILTGVQLNKLKYLDLKPELIQQFIISIPSVSATHHNEIHNYFFSVPEKRFLLETTSPYWVGNSCNYETIKKNNKSYFSGVADCTGSNSTVPDPGCAPGQVSQIYYGAAG